MSLMPSNMVELGTLAPDFKLPDVISGNEISLPEIMREKGVLIMFVCNHCPYVKHIQMELPKLANDYMEKGIGFAAISSNDIEAYPEDGPDEMREEARRWQYPFPYLFDESQQVAREYDAACTPDFYLYNSKRQLVYRGQLDDARPGNDVQVTGKDLRTAMNDLIMDNPIDKNQKPSAGCNIKWK